MELLDLNGSSMDDTDTENEHQVMEIIEDDE